MSPITAFRVASRDRVVPFDTPPPATPDDDAMLYERTRNEGSRVCIRRVSARGAMPVIAVLEWATTAARPLALLEVAAETELDVLVLLEPYARSESAMARLADGLRGAA